MARKFHLVSTAPEGTLLPKRSTKHSAGYDFFSPIDAEIMPGATLNIRTDIKVEMNEDEVLLILPRSSYGYKYQMSLVTTVSVIFTTTNPMKVILLLRLRIMVQNLYILQKMKHLLKVSLLSI